MGIPSESLSFIFEKFRQSDGSRTRAFDGAGLGLYIAKRYADLLGGELSVSSEVGCGSTFTLKLPQGFDAARLPKRFGLCTTERPITAKRFRA